MKPIDVRNECWADIQARVCGDRLRVYGFWKDYGPCTTQELSEKTGMSILSLRPRTTELYQLGLVELVDAAGGGKQGVYRAVDLDMAQRAFENRKALDVNQKQFAFGM